MVSIKPYSRLNPSGMTFLFGFSVPPSFRASVVKEFMQIYLKKGHKSGWVKDGFEGLFDEDLDALFHSPDSTIIKDQERIKVCKVGWNGEDIYIKRYNPYSIWSRVEGTLTGSKALRSWKGAMILSESGFNTAEPLAAIECKRLGLPGESFYVTKEIKDSRISVYYYREEFLEKKGSVRKRRAFLRSLAGLFRDLHEKGIYHNDLKDYNILVTDDAPNRRFYLLDLEGVRKFKVLSLNRKVKNLVQIYRTLGEHLSRPDKVSFFKEYAKDNEWKGLARKVISEAELEDGRKEKRNQGLKRQRKY
jgi:tRNA A-37 threonylcarbamoyl transferase component Bud32